MSKISLFHILIAIALSVAIVATPMGHILFAIPWLIVVTFASTREAGFGHGATTFASYVAVTLIVVITAFFAPFKTQELVLERRLELPCTELTIAEITREKDSEFAQWLPSYIYVSAVPEEANKLIRFPATELTLREFIETIESQSSLRHRFMHCGNGSSILFGGDCCFGVRMR